MERVIIIAGEAESGKDTVAECFADYFEKDGKRVLITHYADLLKYSCRSFLDWDGKKDKAGRQLLQFVGTDFVRDTFCKDYWVNYLWMMLLAAEDNWDIAIIADARYENELNCSKRTSRFAKEPEINTVKVTREKKNSLSDEERKHSSESGISKLKTDYEIKNNGDTERLKRETEIVAAKVDGKENREAFPGDVIRIAHTDGTKTFAIVLAYLAGWNTQLWILNLDGEVRTTPKDRVEVVGSVSEEFHEMLEMANLIAKR